MNLPVLSVSGWARFTTGAQVSATIVGMLLVSISLFAQSNQGRILGTVRDASGGTIAGATVTVTDTLKGVTRTLTTDEAGEYAAPNLDPSTYRVRVEYKGFKTYDRQGLEITVGQEAKVDVTMQPGEQNQTVTVTEAVPLVETTSATLTGNIESEKIADLPLNGRNFVNLLTLRPGFVNQPGGGGGNQSSMGLRPGDSMFLIDGLNMYEWGQGSQLLNGYAPAGDAATILPIDAIQDFNIQQDPKAEVGWKPGVAINVGLKSGTNSIHGSAYAFGRDGSWDAKNFFNPAGQPGAPLAFEQYGGTAGGPVLKDKLFWYVGFEAQTLNLGVVSAVKGPADVSITGKDFTNNMVDACNDLNTNHKTISTLSAQLAGLNPATCAVTQPSATVENVFPYNPGTQFPSLGAKFVVPGGLAAMADVNGTYNGLAKVDYHPDDKSTLSGMFFIADGSGTWNDNPSAIASNFYESLFPVKARVGSGSWTFVPNSALVNELKVGYTHYQLPFFSADHTANAASPWGIAGGFPTGYDINTGVTNPLYYGFPKISVSGFTTLGGNWPKIVGPNQNLEFVDHISLLKGKHAFKFGGEFTYVETTSGATSNAKGSIKFSNLENFLTGTVGGGSSIFVGDAVRDVHTNHFAGFFQDDFRATSRLTINLGVRYELGTVWADANNRLGNFDPNSPTGFVQVGDGITAPYNPDHRDWSPRAGFAWDIFGNQKTVLRAGAGLLYEFVPSSAYLNSGGNAVGLGKVPSGADICIGTSCVAGTGNIAAATFNPDPTGLSAGWNSCTTAPCGNAPQPIFAAGAIACGTSVAIPAGTYPAGSPFAALNGTKPVPCSTAAYNRNLRTPYIETWNMDIQHSFTNNLSLDIAYIGNHGTKIFGTRDINAPAVGAGWGDPTVVGTAANTCITSAGYSKCKPNAALEVGPYHSRFPYISYIDQLSNQDRSHYNALQLSLTQRTSHGLSFTASYTYSHGLDDASQNFGSSIPLNNSFPDGNYGNSSYDIRNRFTFELHYALPSIKSPAQLLQGWAINSIVTIQPGTPWGAQDSNGSGLDDFSGTGEFSNPNAFGEAWDFAGKAGDFTASPVGIPYFPGVASFAAGKAPSGLSAAAPTANAACNAAATAMGQLALASLANAGCYANGSSVLVPPPYGQYGTAGRNLFRNPSFHTWDFSMTKDFRIKERLTVQFRGELFNVLNHPVFGQVDGGHLANDDPSAGSIANAVETPDAAAGNPVLGSGSARDVQLGLKLIW